MKFVLAPDSFKETMTASEVASTMSGAIKDIFPDAECVEVPMADGGEGTTHSMIATLGGELRQVGVVDALGRPREAVYGWVEEKRLAVVEVAQTVGIEHLSENERDPLVTSSVGVGQMLNHVLDLDPERVIIGLGGSATNDGGLGIAKALGVRVFDSSGRDIPTKALSLQDAVGIDSSNLDPRWKDVAIILASDVDNPLTGKYGASAVFGPQKGVKPEEVEAFDLALANWGRLLDSDLHHPVSNQPGAGAAGGIGVALMAFLGATTRRGVDVVMEAVELEQKIMDADFVFTGEGSIDYQTKYGKTPWGVALLAKKHKRPALAFTGKIGAGAETLQESGFSAIIPTVRTIGTLKEALDSAQSSLFESVRMVCRIIAASNCGETVHSYEAK